MSMQTFVTKYPVNQHRLYIYAGIWFFLFFLMIFLDKKYDLISDGEILLFSICSLLPFLLFSIKIRNNWVMQPVRLYFTDQNFSIYSCKKDDSEKENLLYEVKWSEVKAYSFYPTQFTTEITIKSTNSSKRMAFTETSKKTDKERSVFSLFSYYLKKENMRRSEEYKIVRKPLFWESRFVKYLSAAMLITDITLLVCVYHKHGVTKALLPYIYGFIMVLMVYLKSTIIPQRATELFEKSQQVDDNVINWINR